MPTEPNQTNFLERVQTLSGLSRTSGVQLKGDIEYRKVGDRSLKLHLLQPIDTTKTYPLIVFIQGCAFGAAGPQNLYRMIPEFVPFVQNGYVVATLEHRYSNEALFPTQILDIKAAVRFLRANAEVYTIDPERVGAWGDSSGGHLASFLGVTSHSDVFDAEDDEDVVENYVDQSSSVKAVIDWYGPTDFLQMSKFHSIQDHDAADSPESRVVGGAIQENKERTKKANPITYISQDTETPPFLIMHGDNDPLVPYNQSELLYTALKEKGHEATMYKLEGEGHGTNGFHDPRVFEIVQRFFDHHLKGN